jgi:hypothetical protein
LLKVTTTAGITGDEDFGSSGLSQLTDALALIVIKRDPLRIKQMILSRNYPAVACVREVTRRLSDRSR